MKNKVENKKKNKNHTQKTPNTETAVKKKQDSKKTNKAIPKKPETKNKQAAKEETNFQFIQYEAELMEACEELKKVKKFAIDIECENGLHHYGTYVCLIQISTKDSHFIIDTLNFETREKLLPLIQILEDDSIQKVLHDFSFDLRILYSQYECRPKNVFDTQTAALLLGREKIGLASLLEEYCNITAEKKYQRYDWTRRPLSENMLSYAIGDTNNLLFIQETLIEELKKKDRLSWCNEECKEIENKELEYHEQGFYDLKGIRQLTNQQRSILLKLWTLRDELAQKYDKPLHFVLGTKQMVDIATHPPQGEIGFKYLKKTSRYIKENAKLFAKAVEDGKKGEIMMPPAIRKRMSKEQKDSLEKLEERRNKIAEKHHIRGHLIANNDQLLEITLTEKMDCLRDWQKKLLK